jgi:hypothetical protein
MTTDDFRVKLDRLIADLRANGGRPAWIFIPRAALSSFPDASQRDGWYGSLRLILSDLCAPGSVYIMPADSPATAFRVALQGCE